MRHRHQTVVPDAAFLETAGLGTGLSANRIADDEIGRPGQEHHEGIRPRLPERMRTGSSPAPAEPRARSRARPSR